MTLPRTFEAKVPIFVTDRVRGGLYVYRHAAG